ncbi:MAG: hypothetical protein ACFHWZ_17200 [Phycisphaerales bacterium]
MPRGGRSDRPSSRFASRRDWISRAKPARSCAAACRGPVATSHSASACSASARRWRIWATPTSTRARSTLTARVADAPVDERVAALALVTEVARRTTGLLAHREQIASALAMVDGCVVEMATGEGKTLSALLASPLLAAARKGCHVVTANDYLASRDADWTRSCLERLGFGVEAITGESGTDARRRAYSADVTYSTSRELAADFLRDRLALGEVRAVGSHALRVLIAGPRAVAQPLQRGLHRAIVDEADFVLIDDAVTPLLISADDGSAPGAESYEQARRIALELTEGEHFSVDRAHREIRLLARANGEIDRLASGGAGSAAAA